MVVHCIVSPFINFNSIVTDNFWQLCILYAVLFCQEFVVVGFIYKNGMLTSVFYVVALSVLS